MLEFAKYFMKTGYCNTHFSSNIFPFNFFFVILFGEKVAHNENYIEIFVHKKKKKKIFSK